MMDLPLIFVKKESVISKYDYTDICIAVYFNVIISTSLKQTPIRQYNM